MSADRIDPEGQAATPAAAATAAASAPAPGARLRAERERRGLSVQRVADDLHLDPWVVEALEADDHSRLGPVVYVKGHVRHYAVLLGLSVEALLADLGPARGAPAPATPPAAAPQGLALTVRTRPRLPQGLPMRELAAAAAALLVLIGGWWWKTWQRPAPAGGHVAVPHPAALPVARAAIDAPMSSAATAPAPTAATVPAPTAATAPPSTAAAAAPAVTEVVPGAAAAAPRQGSVAAAAPAAAAPMLARAGDASGRVLLRLSFSADSWVDVRDAAGKRLFAGMGRANTVKTLAGAAPLKVHLGYASGVQLEVNQRVVAIGAEFLYGDVARFDADADGVLRRDRASLEAAPPAGAATPLPPTVRGAARRRLPPHG